MNAPAKIKRDIFAPTPAERLRDMAASDMAAVNDLIIDNMQSPIGLIPDLADHLVGAGGKRLRPLLTIACAHLCNYQGDAHHKLAAAVEFIHSATLLHDDVIDESQLRRGQKPANLIWGNSASILVGDFLFARAFTLMVETGSIKALEILSRAASIIAEGEVQQLSILGRLDISEATYMNVIGAKTAALFSAATEVPAVISNSSNDVHAALSEYGQALGLAFQIVDDVLDYGGLETTLGKSVGDDFREGKVTLPIIKAYSQADESERKFWHRIFEKREQTETDLETALSILRETQSLRTTLDLAQKYADTAKNALSIFPQSPWRITLEDLADYVVARLS